MSELKAYRFWGQDEVWPDANLGSDYYLKSEADKVIADLEESHKKEVGQLLIEIAGLKKLVETADKLLKPKGGFKIKTVTFGGDDENWNRLCVKYNKLIELKKDFFEKFKDIELEIDK